MNNPIKPVTNYTIPDANIYNPQNLISIKEVKTPTSPLKILGIASLVIGIVAEIALASIAIKIAVGTFVTIGMALSFTPFLPIAMIATGALFLIIAGAILIAQKSDH